jgi:EmrB/QacA subfamily drug resistance transporter
MPDDRRWWILGVLVLSLVVVMTANTSLNLAIPSLVRDAGASSTQLQWIVDAYALVFGGLVLTAGAVGDRFGRKGALLWGLVIFGSMALLATAAETPGALIAIRAVQGLGAALIMPGTLSILTAVFPPHERARAIGVWAGFAASGAALGILGSGWLLENFWWGSVFFVNVPIAATAFVLVALLVPTSRDPRRVPLDTVGATLSVVALGGLLFGIIEGPERGWTDPLTVAGFVVAALGLVAFLAWENHTSEPMLDLRFFTNAGFSIGTTTITLTFFAMFGMWFLMTQYLQSVRGYTPLEAGVRILPMVAAMMLSAPRSAGLAERFGRRAVISIGLALMAIALGIMASLDANTSYWVIALGFVLLGVGMGNVGAPATSAVMSSLPVAKAGVGSAVNDTAREVGGALGIAVLGSLLATGYRTNLDDAAVDVAAPSAAVAEQSVGAALQEAARLGEAGPALADAARTAYVDAMSTALCVAALVLLATIALVVRYVPRHRGPAVEPVLASAADDDAGAVVARGLVKRFGSNVALDGVDLEVPAGSVTAVLGPNGAAPVAVRAFRRSTAT